MPQVKIERTYEVIVMDGMFIAVVLPYRKGRLPISKTAITSSMCVEITGADQMVEVLGNPANPCTTSMIELLRTHHEGMLLVEMYDMDDPHSAGFEPGVPPVAGEQKLRAPLLKPA